MYLHLRKTNTTISDEALDFMKDVCMQNIKENIVAEFEAHGSYKEIYFIDEYLNEHEIVTDMNTDGKKYKVIIKEVE